MIFFYVGVMICLLSDIKLPFDRWDFILYALQYFTSGYLCVHLQLECAGDISAVYLLLLFLLQ